MIRNYENSDLEEIKRIHSLSGLPQNCLPDPTQKQFVVKLAAEEQGRVVQAGFVRLTGEAYVLVDHRFSTPELRWEILQSLVIRGLHDAGKKDLTEVTAWVPPKLAESFEPRLKALSFERSPWPSFTAILK